MKNNVSVEGGKVFVREYEGRKLYSLGLSAKKFVDGHQTDEYVNAYLNVNFPRDNAPAESTKINVTRGFLAPYEDKDGNGQIKLVIQEWEEDIVPWE